MATKQYQSSKSAVGKVNVADMKACMSKQKGMPPFIARAKCLKQMAAGKK